MRRRKWAHKCRTACPRRSGRDRLGRASRRHRATRHPSGLILLDVHSPGTKLVQTAPTKQSRPWRQRARGARSRSAARVSGSSAPLRRCRPIYRPSLGLDAFVVAPSAGRGQQWKPQTREGGDLSQDPVVWSYWCIRRFLQQTFISECYWVLATSKALPEPTCLPEPLLHLPGTRGVVKRKSCHPRRHGRSAKIGSCASGRQLRTCCGQTGRRPQQEGESVHDEQRRGRARANGAG